MDYLIQFGILIFVQYAERNLQTEYNITPIPKPRMTQKDKWLKPPRPPVQRYWDFCLQCKLEKVVLPCYGARVTFVLPIPKSYSQKRRNEWIGKPHMQRPDLSNLLKALEDAIYQEDSGIYDIWIEKKWGYHGMIIISDHKKED